MWRYRDSRQQRPRTVPTNTGRDPQMTEKPMVFIERENGYFRVSKLGTVDTLAHDPEYLVHYRRNSLEYHLRNLEEFAHRAELAGNLCLRERLQEAIKDVRMLIDPASILE